MHAGDDMTESTEAPLEQKPLVRVGINPMFKSISQLQGEPCPLPLLCHTVPESAYSQ